MPAMVKQKAMYVVAALFTTLLCINVVHNAAIRDSSNKAQQLLDQQLGELNDQSNVQPDLNSNIKQESNALHNNVIDGHGDSEGHAFEPDSVVEQRNIEQSDQIQPNVIKLNPNNNIVNSENKAVELNKGDVIQLENVHNADREAQQNANVEQDHDSRENTALRFAPKDVTPKKKVPEQHIFGVGERVVHDPKPLPVVKAPRAIDALVDARPKPDEEQLEADEPLDLDDLQPPDHLDAVRMEQDGHLNRKYQKEVFFGEHEDFENLSEDEMAEQLEQIFAKVDTNKNGYIAGDELEDWIIQKTNEHFTQAVKENADIFSALDTDSDGFISWEEFEVQFLVALGNKEQDARLYARGKEQDIPLDLEDRERLIRYKFKWTEAEQEPVDNRLNEHELQGFRHPESSQIMLLRMVDDILDTLDTNKDGFVTEREFIALSQADDDYNNMDKNWQKQRSKEFKNIIDSNHDGRVNKQELMSYVDPQNPNHAKTEARNLIELGDSNGDDRLSLDEVIENMDLFYGSKMVNTGLSFHDEF